MRPPQPDFQVVSCARPSNGAISRGDHFSHGLCQLRMPPPSAPCSRHSLLLIGFLLKLTPLLLLSLPAMSQPPLRLISPLTLPCTMCMCRQAGKAYRHTHIMHSSTHAYTELAPHAPPLTRAPHAIGTSRAFCVGVSSIRTKRHIGIFLGSLHCGQEKCEW